MYNYDGYEITRFDKKIKILNTYSGDKKEFVLKQKQYNIGKLNIPLSNMCSLNCKYCCEANYMKKPMITNVKTAELLIDTYFEVIVNSAILTAIQLSFDYGGEPMCQFISLKTIILYFKQKCSEYKIKPIVQMTTNGVWDSELLKDVILLVDEFIISMDGYKELQEKNREAANHKSYFDLILYNAKSIYKSKKLKHISSVITEETLKNVNAFCKFFCENFPFSTIRLNPIKFLGGAKNKNFQLITLHDWNLFIDKVHFYIENKVSIIDTRPEKDINIAYQYGCESLAGINWYYWLDGTIGCCTDRNKTDYIIGNINDDIISLNKAKIINITDENNVEKIKKCNDCIAKYYCAGGCPFFRLKIDCEKRKNKYAHLLLKTLK